MSLAINSDKRDGADKPTLYKQIRLDIERRILTGEWPPGHRIPFEHELMARYGCARMTVSKALSELAQADLIERRRRAGTFVRRPKFLSAVLQIADIRAEMRQGFADTQAMIKFSHAELDRRIHGVEDRASMLEERVNKLLERMDRLEAMTATQ